MDKASKIYVSGHSGMVGGAMVRQLQAKGYTNIVCKDSKQLDLRRQADVEDFFKSERPDYVLHFAARVGGIKANMSFPVEFLYDNALINMNVIYAAYKFNVKKLLYLGSSCVYPRLCPQPMLEDYLLSGKLEPTNEGYALAKIMGLKLCEYLNRQFKTDYLALMPPNIYGPGDNFKTDSSHVVPALIRKFVEAKRDNLSSVELWGTGSARREFIYVDEVIDASLYFMNKFDVKDLPSFVNIGIGSDVSIKELAQIIVNETGYNGKIIWNTNMPDGMPQKLLDSGLAKKFGWASKISLPVGIKRTVSWYKNEFFSE